MPPPHEDSAAAAAAASTHHDVAQLAEKHTATPAWLAKVDLPEFKRDIELLGRTLQEGQGQADLDHLNKIIFYNRVLSFIGMATLGMYPNILTICCLSLAVFSRWTMIGHHVCHGGYDKVDKSGRYNRLTFALGSTYRRCVDWLDWMLPEAWNLEHNKLHHYSLNELDDPDLVEANLEFLRDANLPLLVKYAVAILFMFIWKWFYYAPNTFGQMRDDKAKSTSASNTVNEERMYYTLMYVARERAWAFAYDLVFVMLPYFVVQFLIKPLPVLLIFYAADGDENHTRYKYAIVNLFLAELLTNAHSFVMIVTNHAGSDLYRFTTKCQPRSEAFYLRQIVGSADFSCGSDFVDFMHGFLNYQIEHHLFPALSMLSYQKAQPLVRDLCNKHGIPYVQENVLVRLKKTLDIMVGKSHMLVME